MAKKTTKKTTKKDKVNPGKATGSITITFYKNHTGIDYNDVSPFNIFMAAKLIRQEIKERMGIE